MAPLVKQGIIQFLFSTFLHNSEVFGFLTALVFSLLLLIYRPRRVYIFFFIGFSFLLLHFEYLKHIADPLQLQTTAVVVSEDGYVRTRRWLDLLINNFIPLCLYILGWSGILIGLFLAGKKEKNKKRR